MWSMLDVVTPDYHRQITQRVLILLRGSQWHHNWLNINTSSLHRVSCANLIEHGGGLRLPPHTHWRRHTAYNTELLTPFSLVPYIAHRVSRQFSLLVPYVGYYVGDNLFLFSSVPYKSNYVVGWKLCSIKSSRFISFLLLYTEIVW